MPRLPAAAPSAEPASPPDPCTPALLTPVQVRALRGLSMGPRDRALLEILVATRLPVSDLCALRLDGVHWDGLEPHLTWVDGRGRARVAAMNPQVEQALRVWLEHRPAAAGEWLFSGLRPGKRLTRQAVLEALRRHGERVGLTLRWRRRPANPRARVPRPPRAATPLAPGSLPTIGREGELQRLEQYVARGIHVLLVGPLGVGKSHLLAQLRGPRLLRLPCLSPPRESIIALAEELHRRGVPLAGADFAAFRRQQARTSPLGWAQLILAAVKKDEWVLVLDDLSGLSLSSTRLLDTLAEGFAIVAALEKVRPSLRRHFIRFERIRLDPLPPRDARALIRHAAAGAQVEDPLLLETCLLQHTAGNPRAILDTVTRLRKEPVVTRQALRALAPTGAQNEIDITPIIVLPVLLMIALRYVAHGLGDTELYIFAGVGMVVAMGLRYLFARAGRAAAGDAP